jgi:predicted dehydrogenase
MTGGDVTELPPVWGRRQIAKIHSPDLVETKNRKSKTGMNERVRWGVLSTAKIGTAQVIPAMQQSDCCEMVAIASRSQDKAQAAADALGLPRAIGSYDELLADPDIDAIYNPLPNHLHVPWSIKALEAGKHVLCEKPIGLSAAEGRELVAAGQRFPHLKLMEAFMYRHHPQWLKARQWVAAGAIGTLRTIQSFFSYYNVDAENIRNQVDIGGGALFDIGCYCISLSRFIFAAEPTKVLSTVEFDPKLQIDRIASAILQFEQGTSVFTCSTQLEPFQRVLIFGTEGCIEMEIPFNAPPDRGCKLWLQKDKAREEFVCEVCDQYTIQGELFSRAILDDTPVPTPIEDAVHNMDVIEQVFAASR